ncbi:MAG: hypothetical protein K2Y71_03050 [Xanthobacteraceae bacterium]|nr:hypothetical protein [Xanthobacteraceae bacterium]
MRGPLLLQWRLATIAGGFLFGLFADRRPLGESFLAHPIVVYAGIAGLGLLVLRLALRRPVPEVIPERAIVVGFALGIAAFLVGNYRRASYLAALKRRIVDAAFTKFRRAGGIGFPGARDPHRAINAFATLIRQ